MIENRPTCRDCGESLEGDGFKTVIYCPNADDQLTDYAEPDAGPFYCGWNEEEEEEQ